MRSAPALVVLVACSCTGVVGETSGGGGGGSANGGGGTGGGGPACAALGLAITAPTSPTFTNGTVNVTISGTGLGSVDLLVDGMALATLSAAPFQYAWNTASLSEGSHALLARASGCDSASVTVVVDRTAPTVVSRVPAAGSATAWYAQGATVTFSEAMAAATVTSSSVLVDAGVAATATLSDAGTTLTVAFAAPPPVQTPVGLSLTGSLTDLAGNALAPTEWAWQYPLWGQVADAPGAGTKTYGSALAVDHAGNPVVARSERLPSQMFLPRVTRWDGAGWKDLGALDAISDAGAGAYLQALALTGQDQPAVLYLVTTDAGYLNQANVKQWDGAAWQPLGGPLGAPGPDVWGGALAVESTGTLVAAFADGTDGRVARFTGGAWQNVGGSLNVSTGTKVQSINLALDSTDHPIVAFREVGTTGRNVYVKKWDGSAWTQLGTTVNTNNVPGYSPQPLALDSTGTPYVLHDEEDGAFSVPLRVKRWTGSAWERVGPELNVNPRSKGYGTALVIDPQGRAVTAWTEVRPNYQGSLPYTGYVARFEQGQWQVLGPALRKGQGPTVWMTQPSGLALWHGEPVVLDSEFDNGGTVTALYVLGYNAPPEAPYGLSPVTGASPCQLPATPPMLLSATGCFTELNNRTPAAGVFPYRVNSPLWTDAAAKRRWLVLPPDGGTIGFTDAGSWDLPVGSVLIKEFAVELNDGDEASERPMETRFLVRRDATTWQGYSYQWRDTFDEADLLDGTMAVTKTWATDAGPHPQQYPSRAQCLQCHSAGAGSVLGLQTAQLHQVLDYGVAVDDQLRALNHSGAFGATLPAGTLGDFPRLPNPLDTTETLPERARSYLHANCSHCHHPLFWDARITTPLAATGLCSTTQSGSSIPGALRVAPGDAGVSEIIRRTSVRGGVQMPPLGTLAVDTAAVETLTGWINAMTSCP